MFIEKSKKHSQKLSLKVNLFFNKCYYIEEKNIFGQINDYLDFILPFSNEDKKKDFFALSNNFPFTILLILIIIRYFSSERMSLLFLLALILLPFFAYIIINKSFIEKYYSFRLIPFNILTYNEFFKLFFTGYSPYTIINYLTFFISKKNSKVLQISIFGMIFYSSYISVKLLFEYILYIINSSDTKKEYSKELRLFMEKDQKKLFLIYFLIYFLFSYIINL